MDEITEYRAKLLHRLEYQPAELKATLNALPEEQWHERRLPDGRSVHLLAAHLRDLETLAFLPRFRRVLMEDSRSSTRSPLIPGQRKTTTPPSPWSRCWPSSSRRAPRPSR
jgi:hypothetical protein